MAIAFAVPSFDLAAVQAGSSGRWLRRSQRAPEARLRLFCIPYAGGAASAFRNWDNFPTRLVTISRVQLPGREDRFGEPPFTTLGALVRTLAVVILPHIDMPFALFGHSMGALIAFELARELRRRHKITPTQLFVSAHRAPQLPNPHRPLHKLPEESLVRELTRLNAASRDVLEHPELRALLLPLLRADLSVCETYAYSDDDPLDCPISAFGGKEDFKVSERELKAWQEQTKSSFTLKMFAGDHFFLQNAEAEIHQAVAADLSRVQQPAEDRSS